jgi:Flp pilus assembly protein TadD
MMASRRILSCHWLLCLVVVATGCSLPKPWQKATGSDVAQLRGARRDQALRQFEMHRDTAQYQAAMDRWKAGDTFTCEAELRSLVGRNPQHLEARRALADLALERGDAAKAEAELRELLKIAPDDAQTHHSLGLLLQSLQREPEAQEHLAKAAALAPDNMLYQLCAQTASSPAPAPVVARVE